MKKKYLLFGLFISLSFYFYSEVKISLFDNEEYQEIQNPKEWTFNMQKSAYYYLFEKQDLEKIGHFYNFISELKRKAGASIEFVNPVIIAIDNQKFSKYLNDLYEIIPDAFLLENYDGNVYSEAPILYAVRLNNLESVKVFFDKKIFSELTDDMFGSFDRGGVRFKFPYNLLTFLADSNSDSMKNYLISQGVKSEIDINNSDYVLVASEGVYYNPGFKCKYLGTVTPLSEFKVEKITMYKKDGYQWAKIRYDNNKEGWIIVEYLQLPRSYYDGI